MVPRTASSPGLAVPASRYQVSARTFPETLPQVEYARCSGSQGEPGGPISVLENWTWKVSEAFGRQPIRLRATKEDGMWDIHYSGHVIGRLDAKSPDAKTERAVGGGPDQNRRRGAPLNRTERRPQ